MYDQNFIHGHETVTKPHLRALRAQPSRLDRRVDPYERCTRLVKRIAEATGEDWTFGYIGNCDNRSDDRTWCAFRPHPGRVGTHDDRIGHHGTDELDKLATMLTGALAMATMLRSN